jgi:hypothetical protein
MTCFLLGCVIRPMISEVQHGFVKGRSTVTSLMQFSNFVIGEMKEGRQVDAKYFSKAFDRVNHGLLLSNLSVKFRGSLLCWMGSYLTDRTQQVKLDDYLSGTLVSYCRYHVSAWYF